MAESRSPATFAIEADNAVAAAALPQLGGPQAHAGNIAPGLTAGAAGVDDTNAKTFRVITDLASGVLAPKIKEAAQEQFISGVQRAMTGEALSEIVADQPWYSDIFAPSSALAGARAYTTQAAIAQWAGKMQEAMPNLAKVGPEELRSAAVGSLQGFLTGDANADALITAGVVEQMAPLFKQHAKAHYIHVQQQASAAQISAWEAEAVVYQGLAAAEANGIGTVSAADKDAAKARLLASVGPFADQSDDSYERNIKTFLEGAASAGNFQVVRLFKEAGLYEKISPDKRAELERTLAVQGRKALDKAIPKYAMEIAMLVNDMKQNPAGIVEKVQALNEKAAKATGITEAELIPPQQLDNIIGRVMLSQAEEDRQAANRKQPTPDVGPTIAHSLLFTAPGALDKAIDTGLVKKTDAERAGLQAWQEAQTPTDKARVLNARTLGAFDTIKSDFVNTLRSPEFQAGVGQMAAVYQGLAENVKPLYFSEADRAVMDRFNAQVRSGMPPEAAWTVTKTGHSITSHLLPDNLRDEASKLIREHVENENENFLGVNAVSDASLRTIEAATMRAYRSDRSNNPADVAVKRAYAQARANGLDVQGRHAIINARVQDRPLATVVGEGVRATAEAFDALMEAKAKAHGSDLENYTVVRSPDRGGQAMLWVEATDADGATRTWNISSQELKAHIVSKIKPAGVAPLAKRSASGPLVDLTQGQ